MQTYVSVSGTCQTEKVIERSRFITTSCHVEGEEQAKAFIDSVRKKYADATHNCYAYICDDLGNLLRFSDDGEPQGTAGMPMLEVLKNRALRQTAVVVTRYFGGVKLGAGGLLRAYSGCVAENLDEAKRVSYEPCAEGEYTVDYSLVDSCMRFFSSHDCSVLNTEYGNAVTFTVAVKQANEQAFNSELINFLNGRITHKPTKQYFYPFPIN